MSAVFAALIAVHGLIHLMGPAKAFGWAELPELTTPISPAMGAVWLAAGASVLATAALVATSSRVWWVAALVAVVLSQVVVLSAWNDARWGTVANLLMLAGGIYGLASQGPRSLAAEYRREVESRLDERPSTAPLLDADLAGLPSPVQHYLRLTGAVGSPPPHHVRAEWRGRIRAAPDDAWMEFTAEQYSFPGEPARFFRMDARRGGLPVDILHIFENGEASMRVRLLSMIPVADARGPQMTQAETVTLLNDMALFMPSALIDPAVVPHLRWEGIDSSSARVSYRIGANEVSAELHFNPDGELVDFISDDRLAASADGASFTRWRWSTPVGDYRSFGPLRLMSRGEGLWHAPDGTFSYIELELVDLEVNGP